jgi:hypothetical protein
MSSMDRGPDGRTFHGDHAYVFYQVPVDARGLPLVLWHGAGDLRQRSFATASSSACR